MSLLNRLLGRIVTLATVMPVAACAGSGARETRSVQNMSVDGEVMLHHLEILSADSLEGRLVGSAGNRIAREYIVQNFRGVGLVPFGESFNSSFPVERNGASLEGVNVVGYLAGRDASDRYIVITAHYDGLGVRDGQIHNGADDNGSGTAALLALAAYFAEHRPSNSMIFAAVDAEEGGLRGSRALVATPPVPLERMSININMDMVSHSDADLYVAGTYHSPLLAPLVERVAARAEVRLALGHDRPELGANDWTNSSDHAPFHEVGIPFLYFGVEDHPDYHRPTDDFETINAGFYVKAVNTILDVLLEVDANMETIVERR